MMIRSFRDSDLDALAGLCEALWPDSSRAEHRKELEAKWARGVSGPYPCAIFVADPVTAPLIGFIEVGMRSHADGCDARVPAGYVEGWYVAEKWRRQGLGSALMKAAENWARAQGCVEMASDTWIDNHGSQEAHAALGYEVVDRCVNYRKALTNVTTRSTADRPVAPGCQPHSFDKT